MTALRRRSEPQMVNEAIMAQVVEAALEQARHSKRWANAIKRGAELMQSNRCLMTGDGTLLVLSESGHNYKVNGTCRMEEGLAPRSPITSLASTARLTGYYSFTTKGHTNKSGLRKCCNTRAALSHPTRPDERKVIRCLKRNLSLQPHQRQLHSNYWN